MIKLTRERPRVVRYRRRYNRASLMYAVDIRMRPEELSRRMSEMRMWLDENRFEPSTFSCHDQSFGVLVSVKFRIAQQAEAFAERFGGRADHSSAVFAEVSLI